MLKIAFLSLLLLPFAAIADEPSVADRQEAIQQMRAEVLGELFSQHEDARAILEQARGYAIFSNTGMNLLMFSTAHGAGILRDHRNGSDTYMKMFGVGGGLGVGLKDYTAVLIFDTEAALDDFRQRGWELSGQADANVDIDQMKLEGGSEVSGNVGPGVRVYQMTDSGFAVQALVQGFRFWADPALND
jgi:lipid-binding SYLF domain-containing protein